ncbi:MAG: PTS sugar transporter subunit IIA [Phycisphaerae bacterium]|nr:PTS sugar transporter subunit IIA [Phycisphaerae bacterium]
MKLADVLRKECIVANARFGDKAEVIREVARLAKQCSVLENVSEQEILVGLQARETLGSTGVGKAVAIPHCRLKSVTEFVVGLITVPSGVDFDSIDAGKVKLIVFIIAPEVESNRHVRLLSVISQMLLTPKVPEKILSEQTPGGVYETCVRDRDADISDREGLAKSLIHVFVQSEDVFRDILQILTGIESSSLVVVGAENASVYLSKLPLFASFWTDEPSNFGRIIIAVVDKKLSNETVRRIESVAGDLGKVAGVMVTVQDITYSAGSLGT